jgi:hypothetical protein
MFSEEFLIDSKSARNFHLAEISDERAQEILNRAKALVFAAWQGQGIASTEQIAEFYEVPPNTVRSAVKVKNYREELNSDGLKVLRGKVLKDVRSIIDLTPDTPQALSWTPRAALRLGMFLRDSPVAKQVRNLLIEMAVQSQPISTKRDLELKIELQQLQNEYQRMGWEIVQATSPRMLAFIRGEVPLERTEIQYVERQTGKPLGTTTNYRILPQLVEDVGLKRNLETDREQVKDILKRKLGMNFETGEGLGEGFFIARPLVIPEERYEDCLYVVAVELYGSEALRAWRHEQQLLPDYLQERGLLSSAQEEEVE